MVLTVTVLVLILAPPEAEGEILILTGPDVANEAEIALVLELLGSAALDSETGAVIWEMRAVLRKVKRKSMVVEMRVEVIICLGEWRVKLPPFLNLLKFTREREDKLFVFVICLFLFANVGSFFVKSFDGVEASVDVAFGVYGKAND